MQGAMFTRFELALNGALWYSGIKPFPEKGFVLNLPSTGHYGIEAGLSYIARASF